MSNTKNEKKNYPFLNSVYYHGPNVKLAVDIALKAVLVAAAVVGTIKLALL